MTKNGILCEVNGKRVYLDPKNTDSTSINFVSHAHSDHLPSKNGGPILASVETNAISDLRGFKMENHIESHEYHGLSIGIVYQRSCFYGLQIRFPQKKRPNINLVGGLVAIFGIFPELNHFSEGWPKHQPVMLTPWL